MKFTSTLQHMCEGLLAIFIRTVRPLNRMILWPLACVFLAPCFHVRGISTAQSEIRLTDLQLTPSAGTLTWISASWDLRVFSEALNSSGDLDQQFSQQVGGQVQVQSTVAGALAQSEATDL